MHVVDLSFVAVQGSCLNTDFSAKSLSHELETYPYMPIYVKKEFKCCRFVTSNMCKWPKLMQLALKTGCPSVSSDNSIVEVYHRVRRWQDHHSTVPSPIPVICSS